MRPFFHGSISPGKLNQQELMFLKWFQILFEPSSEQHRLPRDRPNLSYEVNLSIYNIAVAWGNRESPPLFACKNTGEADTQWWSGFLFSQQQQLQSRKTNEKFITRNAAKKKELSKCCLNGFWSPLSLCCTKAARMKCRATWYSFSIKNPLLFFTIYVWMWGLSTHYSGIKGKAGKLL